MCMYSVSKQLALCKVHAHTDAHRCGLATSAIWKIESATSVGDESDQPRQCS